ncbi:MAG: coproporphyrinogen III oxidase family protein, partial [Bacteroidetes bacterium]
MSGIYIHIPFCRKACTYCDFHFVTGMKRRGEMAAAICRELELRKDFFAPETVIETVYFGGGTPSVLTDKELRSILAAIFAQWNIHPDAEITLEANPDDLSPGKLEQLQEAGINRLSIGVQSFEEEDLRWMNRSHSAAQATAALRDAQAAGFHNLSLDLIFGLPGRSLADWQNNLDRAISLGIPHLSLYALTVEEKTALGWQVQQQKVHLPEDESFGE